MSETNPLDQQIQRRRFLQAMAAVGGAAALPTWMGDMAAAATPVGDDEGILVYIMMDGGNDPLNTLIPFREAAYQQARPTLAFGTSNSLSLTNTRRLHPSLGTLKSLYERGDVAFIEGIGVSGTASLSHFDTMDVVQTGKTSVGGPTSGWLGRFIDGLPGGDDNFHGVSLGYDTPLSVQGVSRQATAIPNYIPDSVAASRADSHVLRQMDVLRLMRGGGYGLGPFGDALGEVNGDAIDVAATIENLFSDQENEYSLVSQMQMAARLINANLGIRVFALSFGSFDTHSNQASRHTESLDEFDAALAAFYEILSANFTSRTLIYTMSEFGRRVRENGSRGTDHGSAGLSMAIGANVKGGMYGALPSLSQLDNSGNLIPTVNYIDAYGTIVETWLKADPSSILGGSTTNLGFLASPKAGSQPPPILAATEDTAHRKHYDSIVKLYLAIFGRTPDEGGLAHWLRVIDGGASMSEVAEAFVASTEFVQTYGSLNNQDFVRLVYRNVLDRTPDAGGEQYWTALLNAGTERGSVMLGFSESPEFANSTRAARFRFDVTGPVGRLYRAYFLRAPDPGGLHYWISSGFTTQTISDEFAKSPEFAARYGSLTNAEFAALIYSNVLEREPDPGGLVYWTESLATGLSRGEVMLGFSDSPEFVAKVLAMS